MMISYVVASHWNAEASNVHERSFESLEDALVAIGSNIVDDGWSDEYEGRGCHAIGVYSTAEDRTANDEGGAPHRVRAVVRIVHGT